MSQVIRPRRPAQTPARGPRKRDVTSHAVSPKRRKRLTPAVGINAQAHVVDDSVGWAVESVDVIRLQLRARKDDFPGEILAQVPGCIERARIS